MFKMKKGAEDSLYVMSTILECLKGNHNFIRMTIIKHCMNLINKEIFSQTEFKEIEVYGERLDSIANWEMNVRRATRCRFIYWIRSLFPYFMKIIIQDKQKLN
mmetsp:Transcript_28419/g.27375  ORF Transcript_28419/g.27375 Transcript_28419/m.27375 type:complete len:103 (+) Transcript_28419:1712-2020(+)